MNDHPWQELLDDQRAEDAAGAARVPKPTAAELDFIRRMLDADAEEDAPRCEFCDLAVPDGDSDYPPYCSRECEQAAGAETYSGVHPRPEEAA